MVVWAIKLFTLMYTAISKSLDITTLTIVHVCILKRCMTKNEKYEINLNRTTCLLFGFQIDNINQTLRLIKMKYNNSCTYREPFMYFCVTCSLGPSRRGWNDIQKAETMVRNIWFVSPLVLSK